MNLSGAECNDDHVDLGRELSSLHTLLRESLLQCQSMNPQHHPTTLHNLPEILDTLSVQLAMSMRAAPPPTAAAAAAPLQPESIYTTTYLSREVQEQLLARLQNMHSSCRDCQQCGPPGSGAAKVHRRPASGSLPSNNYLLGSSQRPARNLQTNDDYVLFSAIDGHEAAAARHYRHHNGHGGGGGHHGSIHSIPSCGVVHRHHRDTKSSSSSPHGSLRLPGDYRGNGAGEEEGEKARKSPVKLAINGDYVDLIRMGTCTFSRIDRSNQRLQVIQSSNQSTSYY